MEWFGIRRKDRELIQHHTCCFGINRSKCVATLALGSRPRQGVARLRAKRKEARESKGRKPGSKGEGIGRVRAKRKPGSHHILPGV
jgi:nucleotidyltransferase/DNA polymerase involved in DNA repair